MFRSVPIGPSGSSYRNAAAHSRKYGCLKLICLAEIGAPSTWVDGCMAKRVHHLHREVIHPIHASAIYASAHFVAPLPLHVCGLLLHRHLPTFFRIAACFVKFASNLMTLLVDSIVDRSRLGLKEVLRYVRATVRLATTSPWYHFRHQCLLDMILPLTVQTLKFHPSQTVVSHG